MIFRGPFPEISVPELSVTEFVLQNLSEHPQKPALIDGPTGRVVTYSELAESISRLASGLSKRGFGKGDVFAILSPNLPEYAIAFHGIAAVGGIVCPINPLYMASEITHQLKDAGAR